MHHRHTPTVLFAQRNMCALGYELYVHNPGVHLGIGVAGNAGRLAGSVIEYDGLCYQAKAHLRCDYHTQEEAIIANAIAAGTPVVLPGGMLVANWGLRRPLDINDTMTYQGIDYTTQHIPSFTKYRHAVSIRSANFFSQEFSGQMDHGKPFQATIVVTAGPNNGCGAGSRQKFPFDQLSMKRTIDPLAHNYTYFRDGVMWALVAMLEEMIINGVNIAIIPGLSTGIYAGAHKPRIVAEYMNGSIIMDALSHISNFGSLEYIVYAFHDAPTAPITLRPYVVGHLTLRAYPPTTPPLQVDQPTPANLPVYPPTPVDLPVYPPTPVDLPVYPPTPVDLPVYPPTPVDLPVYPPTPVDLPPLRVDQPTVPVARPHCLYGVKCYRKNPHHIAKYTHPGDFDW